MDKEKINPIRNRINSRSFIILGIIFLAIIAMAVAFKIFSRSKVIDFSSCSRAGYPVTQTYPAQCRTPNGKTFIQENTSLPTQPPQLANPATQFCLDNGGKSEIRKDKDGNETGFCLFPDQSECEEWQFFRQECQKGQKFCRDLCGDGKCQEIVCQGLNCPCAETMVTCPKDCP